MTARVSASPCSQHRWQKLDIQCRPARYRCVKCSAYGYERGAGISVYSCGKAFFEQQARQLQNRRPTR